MAFLTPSHTEWIQHDTTGFAEHLSNRTINDDEVLVSRDVSSLFTEVPFDETIDYIIQEKINEEKILAVICESTTSEGEDQRIYSICVPRVYRNCKHLCNLLLLVAVCVFVILLEKIISA